LILGYPLRDFKRDYYAEKSSKEKKNSSHAEKRRNFTRFARSTCVQNYWIAHARFYFNIISDVLPVGETCGTFHRVFVGPTQRFMTQLTDDGAMQRVTATIMPSWHWLKLVWLAR